MFRTIARRFLNASQIETYHRDGVVILPNLIDPDTISQMRNRALKLVDDWQPAINQTIFRTNEQSRVADEYFFNSAKNISFFLEEDAQDENGNLLYPKHESINKIGHALHDRDPIFKDYSYSTKFKQILQSLGYLKPMIVQSMYIMKPPRIGGYVNPHQDNTYIMSSPATTIGFWVAIDDATIENACMYGIPGSHKHGTKKYWRKTEQGMAHTGEDEYDTDGAVCLEAKAGTVVFFHGDFIHWSGINTSKQERHAYTLHIVETKNTTWRSDNWLQRDDFNIMKLD